VPHYNAFLATHIITRSLLFPRHAYFGLNKFNYKCSHDAIRLHSTGLYLTGQSDNE
jgi:hypothetical protein